MKNRLHAKSGESWDLLSADCPVADRCVLYCSSNSTSTTTATPTSTPLHPDHHHDYTDDDYYDHNRPITTLPPTTTTTAASSTVLTIINGNIPKIIHWHNSRLGSYCGLRYD